jgi:hypothetical protein
MADPEILAAIDAAGRELARLAGPSWTMELTVPADVEAWPCPGGCGGITEDEAGGPCRRCWDEVDRRERAERAAEWSDDRD